VQIFLHGIPFPIYDKNNVNGRDIRLQLRLGGQLRLSEKYIP
jgi:hypothetical protein